MIIEFNNGYDTKIELVKSDVFLKELEPLKDNKLFEGKLNQLYSTLDFNNKGIIYLGIGQGEIELDELKALGFKLGNLLNSRKVVNASINLKLLNNDPKLIKVLFEGLSNTQYNFDYYKLEKATPTLKVISFLNVNQEIIKEANNVIKGINIARDLVNLTPIDLYPESYAKYIENLFKDTKVVVEILDKKAIEALEMHALLAVNRGSQHEPRFVVLKYFNDESTTKHTTFVGKGVTYDSGGYAIKPAGSMANMKNDMGGSAAVVGAIHAIALNKLKVNVVGVMALTENMIDGKAFKNGDVISSMKKTTIEVVNTDAEGRLTLADAIYYAATKLETKEIVELATLTGACVVALGSGITGITTNNDELYNKIHEIGKDVLEFNWRMPITKDLINSVKSDIAEIKNSVAGGGGMMTAGIFLDHFAENVPFIHLDIAGTAFSATNKNAPKGASGIGVKTLFEYIKLSQ